MAERALLLIECIANYTEGSNPSHSLKTVSLTKTEIRGAIKDRNHGPALWIPHLIINLL